MNVYHGSTVSVSAPEIIRTDVGRDFGLAFYTTDIQTQAERWAARRAIFRRNAGDVNARAIVSVFDFDLETALRDLKCQSYQDVSLAWLDMVVCCRTHPTYDHGFDVVSGKIADDSVGETVSYVVAGVMPRDVALEKLRFQKINNQIAFCTSKALSCLKYLRSYEVEVRT